MIKNQLMRLVKEKRTLLGVGPMSSNCIDAVIELSNAHRIPILLIASRRQIDSEDFGGGYVNHWTTDKFCRYVFDNDWGGKVYLCRDHGGPWQHPVETANKLGLRDAMKSAKDSYQCDIESGMQIIHIDASVDIHKTPTMEEVLDRVLELYEFCWEKASITNTPLEFEIGTEEQSGATSDALEFEQMLKKVNAYCVKYKMPTPLFVVVQNGTKVVENRNVGSFDIPLRIADEVAPEIQIPIMEKICHNNGTLIKAHNTDYLSDDSLRWYPRLGIHAANVAPEFGVIESMAIIDILEKSGLSSLADDFMQIAFDSRKWEKWMTPNSKASDRTKSIIAGHYIYSTPEFWALKEQMKSELENKGIDLDDFLKDEVKKSIYRYLKNFRMVR